MQRSRRHRRRDREPGRVAVGHALLAGDGLSTVRLGTCPGVRPQRTREKRVRTPCHSQCLAHRSLAARPGSCCRISGRNQNLRGWGWPMGEHAVVVAGGGPTGLMLAGELALAGVDVAIVERRASQDLPGSRAGGLHSRTIEVLDQRGIADDRLYVYVHSDQDHEDRLLNRWGRPRAERPQSRRKPCSYQVTLDGLGRRRRHSTGKSALGRHSESSQRRRPESASLAGHHDDVENDTEFRNVP